MKAVILIKNYPKGLRMATIAKNVIAGCFSVVATTVSVALEFLETGKPDLFICDFNLGDAKLNGLDLIQKEREANPDVAIILISDINLKSLGDNRVIGAYCLRESFSQAQFEDVLREVFLDKKAEAFQQLAGAY